MRRLRRTVGTPLVAATFLHLGGPPVRLGLRWIVEATNTWCRTTASSAATPTVASDTATPRSASPPLS
jgi:hypothetical protein